MYSLQRLVTVVRWPQRVYFVSLMVHIMDFWLRPAKILDLKVWVLIRDVYGEL